METKNIIQATIARICHDLIGPLGTAQIALESEEKQILENCIKSATTTLDIFRTIYNEHSKTEHVLNIFKNYCKENELKIEGQNIAKEIIPTMFFFSQKMLSTSSINFDEKTLNLNNITLTEAEQSALLGNINDINPATVLPYLAYLIYAKKYNIEILNIEAKTWQIKIKQQ